MPILGAYILPHGALALNPGKYSNYPEFSDIHNSSFLIAEEIYTLKPDIIFMSTPHGIALERSYGIYLNTKAYGTAEWNGDFKEYTAELEIAQDESKQILSFLKNNNLQAEGIVAYSEKEPINLRWGEVVPFWYLQQPYKNNTMESIAFPPAIIFSMPRSRVDHCESMVPDCSEIGRLIHDYFYNSHKKIVIVISADLSHIHKTKPIFKLSVNPPFDTENDEGDEFDKFIQKWVEDPITNEQNLYSMASLITKYLSCGYTGFLLLHGVIKEITKRCSIKTSVLCNLHPTYYGMMVARFQILK
jgi:aromatic ring-opening dioxygenase LigB subunit